VAWAPTNVLASPGKRRAKPTRDERVILSSPAISSGSPGMLSQMATASIKGRGEEKKRRFLSFAAAATFGCHSRIPDALRRRT
jgi:hypothetical protein